jgi:hypothetical protein
MIELGRQVNNVSSFVAAAAISRYPSFDDISDP